MSDDIIIGLDKALCVTMLQCYMCNYKCSTYMTIHSKSGKVCGVCFSVTKKSAEKVRKSRHENFATKVRKSIKSLKMHHSKAKSINI